MNRKGTSLVELVVAVALVATMTLSIGAMSGMIATSNAAMEKSTLKMSKANIALETIVEGIKHASPMVDSQGAKMCFLITGGGSSVQFKGINGKIQQVSQSGNQIIHTPDVSNPANTQIVADEVNKLTFSKASGDNRLVIEVSMKSSGNATTVASAVSSSSGKSLSGASGKSLSGASLGDLLSSWLAALGLSNNNANNAGGNNTSNSASNTASSNGSSSDQSVTSSGEQTAMHTSVFAQNSFTSRSTVN
ncbi:MAG: hypothetical protein WC421_04390 [Elusimicrobiales bacterium]